MFRCTVDTNRLRRLKDVTDFTIQAFMLIYNISVGNLVYTTSIDI